MESNRYLWFGVLCCLFSVATATATAEPAEPYKLCEVESVTIYTAKDKPYTRRDRSLYIRLEAALQKYQQGDLTIIDVRRPEQFSQFRIPKSINLPLHQLRHKTFLKSKALLLVNDGRSYLQLESTAEALENSGFHSVSLIDGGLPAWRDFTHLLDGRAASADSLKFMTVKEFLSESNHGPWLVINLGKKGSFREAVNGEIVDLELNSSMTDELNVKIKKKLVPLTRVLFVSDDKHVYKKLSPYLAQLNVSNYHILAQTADYIDKFKEQSRLANANRYRAAKSECQL